MNKCILSGTVMEDPQVYGEGEAAWAFFKLMTTYGMKLPDGSYTDAEQPCQIVADVPHHVKTIREFIKKGKALAVDCYYRTWVTGGQLNHGFFVRSLTFAKANWGVDQQNGPPGLPH